MMAYRGEPGAGANLDAHPTAAARRQTTQRTGRLSDQSGWSQTPTRAERETNIFGASSLI
jgi:hypothetical protein